MARTLSGLLDRRHVPAWHDLTDASRRRVTLDKLMSVTEEMGFVISKMSKGITRDVSDDDDDDESDEKRASRDEKTNLKSSDEDEERKGPTYIVTPNICKILMFFYIHPCLFQFTPKATGLKFISTQGHHLLQKVPRAAY